MKISPCERMVMHRTLDMKEEVSVFVWINSKNDKQKKNKQKTKQKGTINGEYA